MELKDNPIEIGLKFSQWKIANREVKVLLIAGSTLFAGGLQLVIEQNLKESGLKIQIVETIRNEQILDLNHRHELELFLKKKGFSLVLLSVLPEFEVTVQTGQILRQAGPEIPILWLDMPDDPQKIIRCIKTQASGFILDNEKPEYFCDYLVQALKGEVVCPPQCLKYIFERLSRPEEPELHRYAVPLTLPGGQFDLTRREQEVLSAIAANLNNRQIAEKLSIELCTVKNHVHHIMEKLQVNNRQDAIRYCQLRYLKRSQI